MPIRMRISYNSIRPEIYIGASVRPSEWDKETSRITDKTDKRNAVIKKSEIIVDDIFNEFEVLQKRFPSADELKQMFNERSGKNVSAEVIENPKQYPVHKLKALHIESQAEVKDWEYNTVKNHRKLIHHFKHFYKGKTADELTEKDLTDFIKYLQSGPVDKNGDKTDPHKNSSIRRAYRDFKSMLIWASKKGYYNGSVHNTFEPRFKGTEEKLSDVIFLSWEELLKLYNHQFDKASWNEVKDVFCFCCFTSLRFSDVEKLKKSHIRNDKIVVATRKTTDPLVIDLNNYSTAILAKYKDLQHPKDLALPVPSLKHLNEQIKLIGKEMDFDDPVREVYFIGNKYHEETYQKWQLLTSHAARRTFIVAALTLGIPVEVIIKWTGHKDYEAMKPYVKIVDELKKKEMNKFNVPPKMPPKISD